MATAETNAGPAPALYASANPTAQAVRLFAWINLGLLAAFLINNYLIFWLGAPGLAPIAAGEAGLISWLQAASYIVAIGGAVFLVAQTARRTLRNDSDRMSNANAYFIRACFWSVFTIGLVDMTLSFLVVEELLAGIVGDDLTTKLQNSQFRGPYVHVPLILASFVIAAFSRTLGFHWLAALVVVAELLIVIGRFIFSYEQAFMGDLVRFWYAALFLFASAYTLLEDGHVRVDVVYAGLRRPTQGRLNAIGCVLLGLTLCWTVLLAGMWGRAHVINAPILAFELGQQKYGMHIKYMLAAFIGVFAVSMLIQFCAYLLESVADAREEPGARERAEAGAH